MKKTVKSKTIRPRVRHAEKPGLTRQQETGAAPDPLAAGETGATWTWRDVTMRVDVAGAQHNYRISGTGPDGQRYVIRMGSVRHWESIQGLLEGFHVRRYVIHKYETRDS